MRQYLACQSLANFDSFLNVFGAKIDNYKFRGHFGDFDKVHQKILKISRILRKNVNLWRVNLWGKTVIFQLFKLGAYIDMVYMRSYNVRYMKMYST